MASTASGADAPHTAPMRPVAVWQPSITTRTAPDGTVYVEQDIPLPPYPDRVTDPLVDWAARQPEKPLYAERAPSGDWRYLTFGDALAGARALGEALLDAGLTPERPLAILSGNSLDHALLALAALHVGVPYAAVSPAYSLVSKDFARLRGVFETIDPGMVYADDAEAFGPAIDAVAAPDCRRLFSRNAPEAAQTFDAARATIPTAAVETAHDAITRETIAKFLLTSGSTGTPKAVINTHGMICANQIMSREVFAFFKTEPPELLDWAPWHHTAGGNKLFFLPLFNGGTLHIDDGNPTPAGVEKTVRNLREVSPNWYFNVPMGFDALIPHLEADAALRESLFKNLKLLWYAGAGMAQHTWDAFERISVETIGARVLMATGLGATETAPASLMCTWAQDKPGNIGLPCPGLSLKLVPMDGKLDARVKGPNVTPGYWRAPDLTAKSFDEEGYYRFGDALRPADPDDFSKGFFFDGRTAENFKLDTGTWVATGALRTAFIDHFAGLVSDVAIAGADRPFLTALAFPDPAAVRRIAGAPENAPIAGLFDDDAVREDFRARLAALAERSTGSSNRVRRMLLVDPPPSPETGELTDKGSVNQRAVLRNRAELVEELYGTSPRVIEI